MWWLKMVSCWFKGLVLGCGVVLVYYWVVNVLIIQGLLCFGIGWLLGAIVDLLRGVKNG